jgi:hypothetical protein
MANFAGTCVSRHGLANGARPSRRRKKSLLQPEGLTPPLFERRVERRQTDGLRGAYER